MKRSLYKAVLHISATIFLVGGGFVAVAGIAGGFGADSLTKRAGLAVAGIVIFLIGLYSLYLACDKDISRAIGKILGALFISISG